MERRQLKHIRLSGVYLGKRNIKIYDDNNRTKTTILNI